jgi:hypothetical protein
MKYTQDQPGDPQTSKRADLRGAAKDEPHFIGSDSVAFKYAISDVLSQYGDAMKRMANGDQRNE